MVPSDMVVSPAKLTRLLTLGLELLSSMSIFLSVSLKITSMVLPVSTKIRETSQSPIVSMMTSGSLCRIYNPFVCRQLRVMGVCFIGLCVAFSSCVAFLSWAASTLVAWRNPLMMMLIFRRGGGGRTSSRASSGLSLFGDLISILASFFTSLSTRIDSLLGRRSATVFPSAFVVSPTSFAVG